MNSNSNETDVTQGQSWVVVGCVLAAIAVACGAIGAHMLEKWLAANFDDAARREELWETASRYLTYHAIGLIGVGLATFLPRRRQNVAGYLMFVGVALFSGCLFVYVVTNIKFLVHVVPLGGMTMILSWVMFAWFSFRARNCSEVKG